VQQDDERAARMTFLIDKQGTVRFIDTNVNVQTHGADVLMKLRALKMIP
jgi:peroxiredoxin